uniref:Uncharacterized protein n=1 Tax=viral metagenome TaxID=1070528 RepID=A0A6M3IF05_9ZZZZ
MAKTLKEVMVQIIVTKDEAGEVQVSETAHLTVSADEYPEFESRKGIPITLTPTQETAIINHIKNVVLPQAEEKK